jgi:hypothetical protein
MKSLPCSHVRFASYRPSAGLAVRGIAKPGLVVAAHRNLPRAPRLKRANQDRRRERRSDEHELLKQHPLDRPKSTEQRDQKRNRQDRRHFRAALERQAQSLVASRVQNAAARFQFPVSTKAREFVNAFVHRIGPSPTQTAWRRNGDETGRQGSGCWTPNPTRLYGCQQTTLLGEAPASGHGSQQIRRQI